MYAYFKKIHFNVRFFVASWADKSHTYMYVEQAH